MVGQSGAWSEEEKRWLERERESVVKTYADHPAFLLEVGVGSSRLAKRC